MATIQLGNTKVANKLISYCEKKAVEKEGVNCDSQYAKSQFQVTRELWGKTEGIQAHHVIQSFKPGEVTPGLANQIGKDLAEKLGKGHEAVVYTHADKNHIHNHIVINSVSYEDGKKLHLHGNKAIEKVREMSDQLCKERDLSIIKEPSAKVRYTMAEKGLIEKGKVSWKDELRQVIDHEKSNSKDYKDFKKNLTEKYGIEVNDKGKHITYKHPDHSRVVRGNKLGLDYERGTIENGFSRQIERGNSEERGISNLSNTRAEHIKGTRGVDEGNKRTQQIDAGVHKSSHERGHSNENDNRPRTKQNKSDQSRSSRKDGFDIGKAREHAERLRSETSSAYGQWKEGNEREQSNDHNSNGRNREHSKNGLGKAEQQHGKQLEIDRGKDFFPSR